MKAALFMGFGGLNLQHLAHDMQHVRGARGTGPSQLAPCPTMPPAIGRPLLTCRRMVTAAVCQSAKHDGPGRFVVQVKQCGRGDGGRIGVFSHIKRSFKGKRSQHPHPCPLSLSEHGFALGQHLVADFFGDPCFQAAPAQIHLATVAAAQQATGTAGVAAVGR